MKNKKKKINYINLCIHILLAVGGLSMVLPFIWMISTSIKPLSEVFQSPPNLLPSKVIFSSYKEALEIVPMIKYFFNTAIIVFGRIGGEIFVSASVAYGFARFEFRGKKVLFLLLLSLMMMPYEVTMIP
ncbi:MAG: carbohydrate ABC transporter permease, partial [Clostridiales bacterium]|nr:carbohydrate ABC transporter permease [Clostridiales bacterium]